ncbi:MAG: DHH family phosphoesterase [Bacteroidaceae bacterium]|nr:DHH family phosphoesterase [Bacteroidaceae bacterium]
MEKILTEEELSKFSGMIDNARKVVVCAHVSPDGDAIGSTLALKHWLTRKGKQVMVVVPNMFPDFLRWMPGVQDVKVFLKHEDKVEPLVAEADLFIITDLNDSKRMMEMEACVLANPAPKIMIDHHLEPADFCQLVISRPDMCASAEVICHLLYQLGELEHITSDEATCLYAAMMCDTGAFTFNSNRAVVYECISHLLNCGIDKDKIYRNVFWTYSLARMRLTGYLLYVKMEVLPELHASIITLTNKERKMLGVKNGDTEGIVNMPLQISGMRLSVFLSEDTEHAGVVKVSLRSVDDFPCNTMSAQFFNGGGHKNASGGRLACGMDEAVQKVREAIKSYAHLLK